MSDTNGWINDEDLAMDQASDGPPPPLEDGVYRAVIVKAEPKKVTKEQKPGLGIELRVVQAFGSDDELKRKMFATHGVSRDTNWQIKALARAAGVEPPKKASFEQVNEFCENLVGQSIWIKSKRRAWNGKVNANVDRYLTADQCEAAAKDSTPSETTEATADVASIDAPRFKRAGGGKR